VITEQIEALLALQDVDVTLLQLKKEAQGIPPRQEAVKANAAGARERLAQAKEAVKAAESAIKQFELDVEGLRTQQNRYRQQQMEAKDNEVYKTLGHEIEMVDEKVSAIEDQELEAMDRLEETKASVVEAEANLKEAEALVDTDVAQLEERLNVIKSTFAECKSKREALAAPVDADVMKRYMNQLQSKQDKVVVPMNELNCGGCNMKLTPQHAHDAHAGQKWVNCSYCGRMLYDRTVIKYKSKLL